MEKQVLVILICLFSVKTLAQKISLTFKNQSSEIEFSDEQQILPIKYITKFNGIVNPNDYDIQILPHNEHTSLKKESYDLLLNQNNLSNLNDGKMSYY